MNKNSKKRGCNFTPSEKYTLLEIVNKYIDILENKCTNAVNVQKKQDTWQEVARFYNSVATSGPRTWLQLRHAYENIKQRTKKNIATENKQQYCQLKLKAAEDKVMIRDTSCDDFAAVYCDENEVHVKRDPNMIEIEIENLEKTELKKNVVEIEDNAINEPSCSKSIDNKERAKKKYIKTVQKTSTIKEQYFKMKLENARLERKYFIQREKKEKLEILLLKLKIKRFTARRKQNTT